MARLTYITTASCVFAVLDGTSAWSVQRRDSNTVPALQTLDMPLSFDSKGRYILPVTMSSSSFPQKFNFTLSTGTGLTYVAGSGCSDCSNLALYDQSKSPSAVPLSGTDNTTFFGQSTSGPLIKENCGAKLSNGSFWAYPNQTVVVVDQQSSNPLLSNGISGIFGLGTNRVSNGSDSNSAITFADSIFGQWLSRNPGHDNFTFGMALQPAGLNPLDGSEAGTLHWLKPDPSYYKPDQVSWVTVSNNAAATSDTSGNGTSSTSGQDWMAELDGWTASVGDTHLSNTASVVADVDPMYPNIYLPTDQARLIHDAIPGSAQAPASLASLGSASQAFTVPCDAQYTFGLVVGSQTFVLNPDSLIIPQSDGSCLSGIEGWTDTSQTEYLIGSRFISTVYLIFNVPRDSSPSMGLSPRIVPINKSTNIGAIVGGTIGGVALVVIIGLTVFYFLHRKANRLRGPFEIEDADKSVGHQAEIEPYTLGSPTPAQRASPRSPTTSTQLSAQSPPNSPHPLQPLLSEEEQHSNALPPPSYEEASSSSGASAIASRPPRDSKGRPSRVSGLSESTTSTLQ